LVNKKFIFLFLLSLLLFQRDSFSSVISKRLLIELDKPGVINCVRAGDLVINCESSSKINLPNIDRSNLPISKEIMVNENKLSLFLKNKEWEFFSFSKPGEGKKFILDFWKSSRKQKVIERKVVTDIINTKVSAGSKSLDSKKVKKQLTKRKKVNNSKKVIKDLDYRYGSVFIWPNRPYSPEVNIGFNFHRKTPDQLIDIKDREVEKSDEEAHLQLTFNLFKKMKWGLMYKSIDLFNQKYPKSKNQDFNEFLKLNSLIKERYINGNTTPTKEIISRLELFTETSENDIFNIAVTRYLLAYYSESNNTSKVLDISTNLYVLARENYYPEVLANSIEFILASLSKKGDLKKIEKLLSDKDVKRFLPKLRVDEFKIYALLEKNQSKRIIKDNENKNIKVVGDLPKSLLFNLAEANFREGNYKVSNKLFDKYISRFSDDLLVSKARLRIALGYELEGRDISLVKRLYKNSMNRSTNVDDRFEAAIRYVGVSYLRSNSKIEYSDAETFLELPKELEKTSISNNHKKLLWLTRLRSFIVAKKYNLAFNYYQKLPIETLKMGDRKVFYGDFSEIILGKMNDEFNRQSYSSVIATYSLLEDRKNYFVPKRAGHSYIESASYLSLGVEKSSAESLRAARMIDTDEDIYPNWVTKNVIKSLRHTLEIVKFELALKESNFNKASEVLSALKNKELKNQLSLKMIFKQRKYKEFVKKAESFIVSDQNKKLSPEQLSAFVKNYCFSLVMTGKFKKSKDVLLSSFENDFIKNKDEGNLEYILLNLIEYYSSPKFSDKDFDSLLTKYDRFFPSGEWRSKVDFITAKKNFSLGNEEEGKRKLEKVINNKNTKEYLKELAKSELALIKIKQKTI
tara:strand:+ start:7748 stop:10318 length:2571 start_codon:yes stop_codon:yes gene_type:complete